MSASNKLRGGEESELTKLKRLWLKPSFADSREFWREQFASQMKQPEIRALLKKKLQINLQWNRQLTEFSQWLSRQDILEAEADAMIQDEEQAAREHPDWTKEQIREDVLKKSYLRARASGDFKLGLKTVAADAKLEALLLDRDKFQFDAAKAALKIWPGIKQISSDKTLSETDKVQAVRQKLFGVLPK